MKTPFLISLLIVESIFCQQPSSGPLNDQRIVDLVSMGVSQQEILRMISSAPKCDFDLRPTSTDALAKLGVSEEVIMGMAAREQGMPVTLKVSSTKASAPASTLNVAGGGLVMSPAVVASPTNKRRVYVAQANDSWSFTADRHFAQGSTHPQAVEVMKTFGESCPNVIVTSNPDNADYRVLFERESNKLARRHNKFAAFDRNGDMVYSASTRNLGNSVRGFCGLI